MVASTRVVGTIVALVLLASASVTSAQTTEVRLGGLMLQVSDSSTAQVFHVVDQISEWDPSTHAQYSRWATQTLSLTADDRRMLERHVALRRLRGWGNGLEPAFLVDTSIEAAAARAVREGLLSAAEAAEEQAVLQHFLPRLAFFLDRQKAHLDAFRAEIATGQAQLEPLVVSLIRFAELKSASVPLFLVANPENGIGGGRANAGRLVLEVPGPDPMGFLFHELLHVLLRQHTAAIRTAAQTAGLTFEVFNEGIALALGPGLVGGRSQPADLLAEQLARYVMGGTPASDPYVQSCTVAVVLRPLLRLSLDTGETVTQFIPKAVERWQSVIAR
jgi:hypothetical protein